MEKEKKNELLMQLVELGTIANKENFEHLSGDQLTELVEKSLEKERSIDEFKQVMTDRVDEVEKLINENADDVLVARNQELTIKLRENNQLLKKFKDSAKIKITELAKIFN